MLYGVLNAGEDCLHVNCVILSGGFCIAGCWRMLPKTLTCGARRHPGQMQLMRLRKTLQSWRSAFGHHCLQGLAHDKFTFHLCWHKVNSAERPTPMNSQPLEAECDTAGCLWGWQQQLPPLSRGSVGGASGVRAVCWQHRDAHSACHAAVRPPTLLPTPWSGRHKLSGDVNMSMLDRYRA